MQKITQKIKAYKRGTIQQLKPFFMSGLITADELESIANSATMKALEEWGSK